MDIFNYKKLKFLESSLSDKNQEIIGLRNQIKDFENQINELKNHEMNLKNEIENLIINNNNLQVRGLNFIRNEVTRLSPKKFTLEFNFKDFNDLAISSISNLLEYYKVKKVVNSFDLIDVKESVKEYKSEANYSNAQGEIKDLLMESTHNKNITVKKVGNVLEIKQKRVSYLFNILSPCSKKEIRLSFHEFEIEEFESKKNKHELFKVMNVIETENGLRIYGDIKTIHELRNAKNQFYLKRLR